jgi:PAS domain S-box-containing protein
MTEPQADPVGEPWPGAAALTAALAQPAAIIDAHGLLLAHNAALAALLRRDPALATALAGLPGAHGAVAVDGAPRRVHQSPLAAPPGARLVQLEDGPAPDPVAEAALLHAVIDALPINVFLKGPDLRMALANQETARTLGRPVEEVLGRANDELFPPAVAAALEAVDTQVLAAGPGEALLHEEQLGPPGAPRTLLAGKRALAGPDGRTYLLGFSLDITARRRAEQELESQRNFVRQVIDTDPNLIFVKDRRNNFRLVNRAVADLFGTTVEAIEGHSNAEVHDNEEEVQGYADDDRQVIDLGLTIQKEETVTQSDGRIFTYQTTKCPLRFPNGEVMALGISVDITERLARLAEAREAQTAAEAASRAKTDFLGAITHEIRTPMNAVIGMSGLLLDGELSPAQRRHAETIRRSAEALLGLVNTIFDFSQIEAGEITLEEAPFDPRALLVGSVELIASRAEAKGLAAHAEADPALPARLRGDAGRIRQIVVNLLQNAVKFTDRGEVRARMGLLPGAGGGRLRVEVIDTGVGVPAPELARLFSAFSQADASASRRFGGLGLGLALSHKLCARMGGKLGAQSAPGRGSTFWFELPVGVAEAPAAPPPPALGGARCLVVTDDDAEAGALAALLEKWDAVVEAPRGVDAGLERLLLAEEGAAPEVLVVGPSAYALAGALRHARVGAAVGAALVVLVPDGAAADPEPLAPPERRVPAADAPALAEALLALRPRRTAAPGAVDLPPNRGRRLRVLVAEDNPVNQEVVRLLIEREGHAADVVADGAEAIAAMAAIPYDLALLDLQMPKVDGISAARAIRALPGAGGRVHLALMAADPSPGERSACIELGITELLNKPVERTRLRAALRSLITRIDGEEQAMTEAQDETAGAPRWPTGPLEAVDEETLAEVLAQLGAESTAVLLQTLLRDGAARVQQMEAQAAEAAYAALGANAHALKSSTGTFGLTVLSTHARQIELLCRAGRGPEAVAGVPMLAGALRAGVEALAARIAAAR